MVAVRTHTIEENTMLTLKALRKAVKSYDKAGMSDDTVVFIRTMHGGPIHQIEDIGEFHENDSNICVTIKSHGIKLPAIEFIIKPTISSSFFGHM
jgi:hypothetical protein